MKILSDFVSLPRHRNSSPQVDNRCSISDRDRCFVYKTDLVIDYIHLPVSSIEHDVSETGSVSVFR
jgi:hypothetical protein